MKQGGENEKGRGESWYLRFHLRIFRVVHDVIMLHPSPLTSGVSVMYLLLKLAIIQSKKREEKKKRTEVWHITRPVPIRK